MKEIYCLFSMDNQYDQPPHNLEAWFEEKPTIEELFKHFVVDMSNNELVVKVVHLWNHQKVRIGETDYWFDKVKPGFGQLE